VLHKLDTAISISLEQKMFTDVYSVSIISSSKAAKPIYISRSLALTVTTISQGVSKQVCEQDAPSISQPTP